MRENRGVLGNEYCKGKFPLLPYFISEHPGMYVTEKSKMDTAQITLARVQSSESAVQKQLLQETINLHCRKY